jgi:hypothetical protein
MLESLDHQNNPEHDADKVQRQTNQTQKTPANDATASHEMHEAQRDPDDRQPAKNHNRLRGRGQKPRNIFLDTFGWGGRGNGSGRNGCGSVRTTLGTEVGSSNVLTTRFAEGHEDTSGELLWAERNKAIARAQ